MYVARVGGRNSPWYHLKMMNRDELMVLKEALVEYGGPGAPAGVAEFTSKAAGHIQHMLDNDVETTGKPMNPQA